MKARISVAAIAVLCSLSAGAATLEQVRTALAPMRGTTAVAAAMERLATVDQNGKKSESRTRADVEADGDAVRIIHRTSDLAASAAKSNDEGPPPATIDAGEAYSLLNFAPGLLRDLEGARLIKQTSGAWRGTPVTILELFLATAMPADKVIKSRVETMTLSVGADGVPVTAKKLARIKGRVLLIGFEMETAAEYEFTRAGDRLIVLRASGRGSGSGMGQRGGGSAVTIVTLRQ